MAFSAEIHEFINSVEWTYAKTMPQWPHEYIVKDDENCNLFMKLNRFIDEHDEPGRFYNRLVHYYRVGNLIYWTMRKGNPKPYTFEEETIINRCPFENSFEYRELHGLLPE
jgi:hypothetical protein